MASPVILHFRVVCQARSRQSRFHYCTNEAVNQQEEHV
jgi:hypothetical protein